ncbi:MAG: acyl-CoA dehydrogenase [Lysobacterales bacterium]
MQPIIEGRYYGTMCLSEPQAGSSLSDIKTRAIPQADGSYRIVGAKMWISAGDHELGENIVHLLLAKIDGAPAGVRGISLFIVPRWRVNADGSRGERNDVQLAGLNHKMGQRGSVNTFLKFGENEDCHAELVGKPHHGLGYMFHMMNEERIGVGMGAVQQGSVGYQYSLKYARERRQGRHPDQKDPTTPPVTLIEHADIRRMLLMQKCYIEGAQVLGFYASMLVDHALDSDETLRRESHQLLEPADAHHQGLRIGLRAQGQRAGDPDPRRLWLHPRLSGRRAVLSATTASIPSTRVPTASRRWICSVAKAMMHHWRAVEAAARQDRRHLRRGCTDRSPAAAGPATRGGGGTGGEGTQIRRRAHGGGRGAGGTGQRPALHDPVLGHLAIAWVWLWQATVAARALPAAKEIDKAFYEGKLLGTAPCFYATELPLIEHAAKLVSQVDDSVAMRDEWFWRRLCRRSRCPQCGLRDGGLPQAGGEM